MRLAPVPPCPSVLPPGAGNEEAEEAVKTGKERAKKTEERYVVETGAVQRDLDAPTIARHDDGDMATIPAIEQTQRVLSRASPGRPGRSAQSTRRSVILQPPAPHHRARRLERMDRPTIGVSRKPRDRRLPGGLDPDWSDPDGPDYFQR